MSVQEASDRAEAIAAKYVDCPVKRLDLAIDLINLIGQVVDEMFARPPQSAKEDCGNQPI